MPPKAKAPIDLRSAAASGDRLAALRELRDLLARSISGVEVPARDVAAAIWPASDPEDMLYELRVYVSRLRLIGYTICNEPIAGTRRFAGYRLLALPFGRRSVETN